MSQHENPQAPYPEHEEASAADAGERRGRRGLLGPVALATGIVAAAGIYATTHESKNGEVFPHQTEAAAVAQRFDCELAKVEDLRQQPEEPLFPGMTDLENLTTVSLTVNTHTKSDSETQTVLKRYEDDDTIWWLEPEVSGSVYDDDKTLDQMQVIVSPRRISFEDGEYTIPVGLHTDYPEGFQILITLNNEAHIMGGENSVASSQVCGAVVYREGIWQAATEMPDVERALTLYQD